MPLAFPESYFSASKNCNAPEIAYQTSEHEHILFIAHRIARSSASEWPHIFEELRRRGHLSATVYGLNRLLDKPDHRELARFALKRLGLDHAG